MLPITSVPQSPATDSILDIDSAGSPVQDVTSGVDTPYGSPAHHTIFISLMRGGIESTDSLQQKLFLFFKDYMAVFDRDLDRDRIDSADKLHAFQDGQVQAFLEKHQDNLVNLRVRAERYAWNNLNIPNVLNIELDHELLVTAADRLNRSFNKIVEHYRQVGQLQKKRRELEAALQRETVSLIQIIIAKYQRKLARQRIFRSELEYLFEKEVLTALFYACHEFVMEKLFNDNQFVHSCIEHGVEGSHVYSEYFVNYTFRSLVYYKMLLQTVEEEQFKSEYTRHQSRRDGRDVVPAQARVASSPVDVYITSRQAGDTHDAAYIKTENAYQHERRRRVAEEQYMAAQGTGNLYEKYKSYAKRELSLRNKTFFFQKRAANIYADARVQGDEHWEAYRKATSPKKFYQNVSYNVFKHPFQRHPGRSCFNTLGAGLLTAGVVFALLNLWNPVGWGILGSIALIKAVFAVIGVISLVLPFSTRGVSWLSKGMGWCGNKISKLFSGFSRGGETPAYLPADYGEFMPLIQSARAAALRQETQPTPVEAISARNYPETSGEHQEWRRPAHPAESAATSLSFYSGVAADATTVLCDSAEGATQMNAADMRLTYR